MDELRTRVTNMRDEHRRIYNGYCAQWEAKYDATIRLTERDDQNFWRGYYMGAASIAADVLTKMGEDMLTLTRSDAVALAAALRETAWTRSKSTVVDDLTRRLDAFLAKQPTT